MALAAWLAVPTPRTQAAAAEAAAAWVAAWTSAAAVAATFVPGGEVHDPLLAESGTHYWHLSCHENHIAWN